MKKAGILAFLVGGLAVLTGTAWAQTTYPPDVLEKYAECQERTDLKAIEDLLWYHRFVQRIDATQYGLPKDDFDDGQLLTIEERLQYRAARKQIEARDPGTVPQATSGPVQYPHYLREAYDHWYEETGQRPDCSKILEEYAGENAPPPEEKTLASSWASDRDLTGADASDRGEVNVAIDHANENRIMASSCPSGAAPDSSSNFIAATSDWGQNWSYTAVGNNSGSTWECDPVSYYQTSTGRVYHSKIGCDTGSCGSTYVMMRYSSDNGSSWADCGRPGSDTAEDRQWHVVDNNPSSACYGNIYITWHNSNQEKVTTSTNNCASWATPTDLTGTYSAITPDINVAADGHVYVVWQNYSDSTFKIAGSDDCGATWTSPSPKTLAARNGDWSNHLISQCQRGVASQPYVDVDRASSSPFYGRVYVMLAMFNNSCSTEAGWSCTDWDSNWNSTCNYDLFFMYSDDNGATFSAPVNITAGDGNTVDNFEGYMRVDPVDGSIWVSYHRSTLNPASASDRQKTRYVVKRSKDGGATWEEMVVSSVDGDERSAGASTFERGDYNGLDVYDGVAWPLWIDRRGGTGEENVIVRKVCSEPAHWSERGSSPSPPPTNVSSNGNGTVQISWDAPDVYWGDGNEDNSQRKYQLWVDGALAQDNISWTATSISSYDPGDCNNHDYFIRAINQCGISKDYATTTFAATGCCTGNPDSVDVTPDGPLTLCTGTSQTLTANLTGGTAPFTYQWYRDGSAISGATSSSYTANDTGTHTYNCEVTGNGCTGGVQDPNDVQITWTNEPSFNGLDTVTNPEAATCELDLSWTAATSPCGSVSYNIYRSATSGFTPSASNRIATGVTGTSYADTDSLVSGTTYYYIVRAVDVSSGTEETNTVEKSGVPTGPSSLGTWTDDVESYSSMTDAENAGYTHAAAQGSDDWRVDTGANHTTGGSRSFASDDVASVTDKWLITPSKHLGASAQLTFYHQYDFEKGSSAYDGGVIEISTDGGSNWSDLGPDITTGGYTDTLSTSYSNPLGGRQAWSGTQSSFTQVVVDLSSYANDDVLIRWRMGCDSSQAAGTWYIDDIEITNTGTVSSCTTGSACTDPGKPVITDVTDDDACAQSGVTITYTAGSGAASHDLYVDGSLAVSGFTSGSSYDPGDTAQHDYVIRAVDQTCYTDSDPYPATDEDNSPGQPVITGIADVSGCTQNGIQVSYTAGSGASSHDLLRDGTVVVTGYTSGATYDPGNTTSHSYVIRAISGSCHTDSAAQSATDEEGAAPAFGGIVSATDADDCEDTGVTVTWNAPTDWGDNGETAGRGFNIYRGTTLVTTVAATATSYTDTGGTNGTTYTYKVEAVNGCSLTSDGGATASAADQVSAAPVFGGIASAADLDQCADSGVELTWSAPSDWGDNGVSTAGRKFNIYRDGSLLTSVAATVTSYTDTSGTNGTSYAYSVEAVNGCNKSSDGGTSISASDDVNGAVFAGISSAVDISACEGSGIRLTWPAVSDWNDGGTNADQRQYQVQRSSNGGASWTTIGTGPENGLTSYTWDDTTTSAGASYTYRIVTVNGTGCQNDGGVTVSATDAEGTAPTFGGVTGAGDHDGCSATGNDVSWTAASDWGDGGSGSRRYDIYRDGSVIASVAEGTTSYQDTDAPVGTSVTYSVKAVNGCGIVDTNTATASATNADAGTPPTFTGLNSVSNPSDGSCGLDLSWSAATASCGGVAYNVYRDTTTGFTPSASNRIASGLTATSYRDGGLTGGTTYYYIVRAYDTSNGAEEGNTNEQSGTVSGGGTTTQTVFYDDFDGSPTPAGHDWITATYSDDGNDGSDWTIAGNRVHNGSYSGQFGDGTQYVDDSNDVLIAGCDGSTGNCGTSGMNGIALPSNATSITLTFWEWHDFESGYDGSFIEYSTTSATSGYTQIPDSDPGSGPYITAVGYTNTLSGYCPPSNTPSGPDIWSGNPGSWQQVTVNLDRLAGQTIWLNWRAITDCSVDREGWYIDEVKIEAEVPGGSCDAVTEDSAPGSSYPAVLVRDDASSTGYYLYFEEIAGASSYNVYEGEVGNFYSHTALATGVTTTKITSGRWNGWLRAEITPTTTGSRYYLVTEVTNGVEGPTGFDSNGNNRP